MLSKAVKVPVIDAMQIIRIHNARPKMNKPDNNKLKIG
jgi:hypothetical protein